MLLRRTPIALAAAIAALAVGVPAAGAITWPTTFAGLPPVAPSGLSLPGNAAGPCGTISNEGVGRAGGNEASVCQGAGLAFIGPSVGAVATIVGPTIMSPGFVGTVIQSTGNVTPVGP
jgi:hypothetical protein